MPDPLPRPPRPGIRGAGAPIILILIAATVIGFLFHQPTIGFLIGAALGLAVALLLWRSDRR